MSAIDRDPIVVVGTACRFPGESSSSSKLWELLRNPRDVLKEFPAHRLRLTNFYAKNGETHGSTDVENKSYLLSEDTNLFDAPFFNINPLEASGMDPQQRLMLETVYEAVENAGHRLEDFQGSRTSVFLGVMNADYYDIQLRDTETMPRYNATGTARSILSNRISYFFDLKGPSMTIDTACSSSLVALHQAVLSIQNQESDAAVVAGANLLLDPSMYIAESKLHMLSPDSRSRMWDQAANGYARGEGFAALIVKRLSRAVKDGDNVDCIIRGSGVNSDGRTAGITMPSSTAQTLLIQQTYQKAGLDPLVDRPQFIECHGTGTAAGDPVEARALRDAFFPEPKKGEKNQIFVGSIKTVIGHLEGCAGLAGVLKAILAMKHRIIPANLHFKTISPAVAPYYTNLKIVSQSQAWPITSGPIRASVNSFGFGGTNAHAILEMPEHADQSLDTHITAGADDSFVGPLTFSANSQISLLKTVENHLRYLESNPSTDLCDLTWTLQTKRSQFPFRTFFSGASRRHLIEYMRRAVSDAGSVSNPEIGTNVRPSRSEDGPAILGIFTGQGAQWASMGRALIEASPVFRESIKNCERSLASLPNAPDWSLMEELTAAKESSRISEAAFSQPLCTALQIALIDLYCAAGLKFAAVVGHSSGEIAAVYAAGILSAHDAIRVAYLRGVFAKYARGTKAQSGAMIAVGMSLEHAQLFCNEESFDGRLCIAASNSPSSVTLSGDQDAVSEAKKTLDKQNVFARVLKVDTAYHSHHMLPCAEHYLASMKECQIQVQTPKGDCVWISSVRGDADLFEDRDFQSLTGQYWVDNMTQTVLFSQAVECALWTAGPFELLVEVGPHPALKGPTIQTIKSTLSEPLPYVGLLRRDTHEVESFSGGMGYIWSHLAEDVITFEQYQQAFTGSTLRNPTILKDLPPYAWTHEKSFWRESRISQQFRLRDSPPQELLGRRVPDDSDFEPRWRNILKLSEIPWLKGHEFQGQALYPATGYLAMALESIKTSNPDFMNQSIVIEDFKVLQAVVIPDNTTGIECIFSLRQEATERYDGKSSKSYQFSSYACLDESRPPMQTSTGRIIVLSNDAYSRGLAPRQRRRAALSPIDNDQFYRRLAKLGLNYHGLFRPEINFERCLDHATGFAKWSSSDLSQNYVVHPALMDVSLHSIFAALSSPISEALWTTYLPVSISRVFFNLQASFQHDQEHTGLNFDAYLTQTSARSMEGNISVFDPAGVPAISIEQLRVQAFEEAKITNDRHLFSHTKWDIDVSEGFAGIRTTPDSTLDSNELAEVMERTSFYYLKSVFGTDIKQKKSVTGHFQHLQNTYICFLHDILNGSNPYGYQAWLEDTQSLIDDLRTKFKGNVDLEMMHKIGRSLPDMLNGKEHLIELVTQDRLLDRFYEDGRIFVPLNKHLAECAKAISHKYPNMKVLEIGAGTGATTKLVLDQIGSKFSSYAFTDISKGFFTQAQLKFAEYHGQMSFHPLDIAQDVEAQGFQKHSFDLVIASNVLHATADLQETMQNVRSLLKPGGFLLMVEVTGQTLQLSYVMGGFSAWWLGIDEGRVNNPGISPRNWERMLQKTGFTGVESIIHDTDDLPRHSCSAVVTRATNQQFEDLSDPLMACEQLELAEKLFVIGTGSLQTTILAKNIARMARKLFQDIIILEDLNHLEGDLSARHSIIVTSELDEPLLSDDMDDLKLRKLQTLLSSDARILWLTAERLTASPASNMVVGLARTLKYETGDINLRFLDFENKADISAHTIVSKMAQLCLYESQTAASSILWTLEPEMSFNGASWQIPRVKAFAELNDIYNAGRRKILSSRQHQSQDSLEMVERAGERSLLAMQDPPSFRRHEIVDVDVCCSTKLCARTSQDLFLCIGTTVSSSHIAIFPTDSARSKFSVPHDGSCILPPAGTDFDTSTILLAISTGLQAAAIWRIAPRHGTLVVFDATEALQKALSISPYRNARDFSVVTSHSTTSQDSIIQPKVQLHLGESAFSLRQKLPTNVSLLVFCEETVVHLSENFPVLSLDKYLPLFLESINSWREILLALFQASIEHMAQFQDSLGIHLLPLAEACQRTPGSPNVVEIIDWRVKQGLEPQIGPLQIKGLLSANKTYLLVGLNSELGLSICRWMITAGARNIVITSRRGQVDGSWLQEVKALGANVVAHPMDVADKTSVLECRRLIESSMPPIAGVCNGAMVLSDKLFEHMKAEDINCVLRPKVRGSVNLNEVFSDTPLDFFVLFSSLASVVGNGGQANYHAANMFMQGLAAQRRREGKAASVVHIGLVCDVGYVARTGQALIDHLLNLFYSPLTESDVHQLIAQSIIASPANSNRCADIGMGLEPIHSDPTALRQPPWWNDPIFSHLRLEHSSSRALETSGGTGVSTNEGIKQAASPEEAVKVLIEAFSKKLEAILHLSEGGANVHIPLLDLGTDSLLAVEIRQWFMSEIGVDVPVLKVLGGDTVADLCHDALLKHSFQQPTSEQRLTAPTIELPPADERIYTRPESAIVSSRDETHVPTATSARSSTPDITSTNTPPSTIDDIEPTKENCLSFQRVGPLSLAQSRLWYQNTLLGSKTLNIAVRFDVNGRLDEERLRRAVELLVYRHETLRTCFYQDSATQTLTQGVMLVAPDRFSSSKVTHAKDIEIELKKLKSHEWDLQYGDTFKVQLITTSQGQQCILIGYHHIVLDGVSWGLFLQELDTAYQCKPLGPSVKQPIDIQNLEQSSLHDREHESELAFWSQQFSDPSEPIALLPFSKVKSRRPISWLQNTTAVVDLNQQFVSDLRHLSRQLKVTPFHVHLTTLQALLQSMTDKDEFCIGITDSNRHNSLMNGTMGFFLNFLPLKLLAQRSLTFAEMATHTKGKVFQSLSHAKVPFERIVDHLHVARSPEHSPLFQVVMNYRMGELVNLPIGDSQLHLRDSIEAQSPFDIVVNVTESSNGQCYIQVTTNDNLYKADVAKLLCKAYTSMLQNVMNNVGVPLNQLPRSIEDAQLSHIHSQIDNYPELDLPSSLTSAVHKHSEYTPAKVAVLEGDHAYTYRDIRDKAASIVQEIKDSDKMLPSHIAVCSDPSANMIASLLAVISLGCTYVPIDPSLPESRKAAMLSASRAVLVLSDPVSARCFENADIKHSYRTIDVSKVMQVKTQDLPVATSHNESFLLFTSGSTGTPKGIVLGEAGFVNFAGHMIQDLGLKNETVLQQSSPGFDMSLAQIYLAFLSGSKLAIVPAATRGDAAAISRMLVDMGVTYTCGTPSEALMWLNSPTLQPQRLTWRNACLGGEVVGHQVRRAFASLQNVAPKVIDCYGPTEISCCVTTQVVDTTRDVIMDDGDFSSVGKPVPNKGLFILDNEGRLVALGMPGEIGVYGTGVAERYYENVDVTSRKFVDITSESGEIVRIYRTGDRGRLLPTGELVFMGRLDGDTEIKLRGLRIDLAEVENAIVRQSEGIIIEAVVSTFGQNQVLGAHVVPALDQLPDRKYLQNLMHGLPLPHYMRPAVAVVVQSLPRSTNGKVDRRSINKLPPPDLFEEEESGGELNLAEGELRLVWADTFGELPQSFVVGPDSDFFNIGGNSHLLAKLQSSIKSTYGLEISMKNLYQYSTISRMASLIHDSQQRLPEIHIDWKSETRISSENSPANRLANGNLKSSVQSGKLNVLLTGASGFLGSNILANLIASQSVSKIYCVAVDEKLASNLPDSDKVELYFGNLSHPSLGLSNQQQGHLEAVTNIIIHAGSHGHCLNNYSSLVAANLGSTRFLTAMAVRSGSTFNYLSSNRTIILSDNPALPPISVASYEPPTNGSEGLTATKWASEQYLENFARQTSAKVRIHRSCAVTGESAPSEDATNAILRYSTLMQTLPEFNDFGGYFDFEDVQVVAQSFVEDVLAHAMPTSPSITPLSFRHYSSGTKIPVGSFRNHVETKTGTSYEQIPLLAWITKAQAMGMDPLIVSYLRALVERQQRMIMPYMGELAGE